MSIFYDDYMVRYDNNNEIVGVCQYQQQTQQVKYFCSPGAYSAGNSYRDAEEMRLDPLQTSMLKLRDKMMGLNDSNR